MRKMELLSLFIFTTLINIIKLLNTNEYFEERKFLNMNFDNFKNNKKYNWISLKEYEPRNFSLLINEEIFFKYNQSQSTIISFENGYYRDCVELYIYLNEDDISYNEKEKKYENYFKKYTNWKEEKINKSNIYLIIKAKENYTDFISFRGKNFEIKDNIPNEYDKFNELNYIHYDLNLENGNSFIIETLSNVKNVTITKLDISLYEGNIHLQTCNINRCHFIFAKIKNSNYSLIIKNYETKLEPNTKLYILMNQRINYYDFSNLTSVYFLTNFEYLFRLEFNLVENVKLSKELVLNYISPKNPELYNISLSYSYQNESQFISEEIDNRNYITYYFNLTNITRQIYNVIIKIKGVLEKGKFIPPGQIGLSYGGPYFINSIKDKFSLKLNYLQGHIIYFTLLKNLKDKYIYSLPEGTKKIYGKVFNGNNEINKGIIIKNKIFLDEGLFENNYDLITLEYNGTEKINAELNYEKINGEIIIRKNREYNNYTNLIELNFKKSNIIYYLGFYDKKYESTYAYVNNPNENIKIYLKHNSDLFPILPNEEFNYNFFPLNSEYEYIKFSYNNSGSTKSNDGLIIFNPNIEEEYLSYSIKGIFYLRKNKLKTIILTNNILKNNKIYRIITKSYNNSKVELTFNSDNTKSYVLSNENQFTNLWEINSDEKFFYTAKSFDDTIISSKILEGSVYERLYIQNNTEIKTSFNNIIFRIEPIKGLQSFLFEIKNLEKKHFYWKIYKFKKGLSKLSKLTIPLLIPDHTEEIFENNKIKISCKNPYLDSTDSDIYFYFALSFEQNLENPEYTESIVKITYNNRKIIYDKIDINKSFYLSKDLFYKTYNLNKPNGENLILLYITYQPNELISSIFDEYNDLNLKIDLNKKYIQKIINASNIYEKNGYYFKINSKEKSKILENSCVIFHYYYSNEKFNIEDFEKYNNKELFIIKKDGNKISWNKLDDALYYEIYISKDISQKELFNNDCYLSNLKSNSDIQIINSKDTFYELDEDNNSDLLINVVAIEKKYNFRIVYEAIEYKKESNSPTIIIILILSSVIIAIIILGLYCYKIFKKNKPKYKNENFVEKIIEGDERLYE